MEDKTAAFFDVDGTLVRASTERLFIRYLLKKGELSLSSLIMTLPYAIILNRGLRGSMKRNKLYLRGKDVDRIKRRAEECFHSEIKKRISPAAKPLVDSHRMRGDVIVLLTGSLDFLTEPLRQYLCADAVIATKVGVMDGRFTGMIEGLHPYGRNKLKLMEEFAISNGIELKRSYAYGNDSSDSIFLSRSNHPVAVNPDYLLLQKAKREGWEILYV